MIQTAAVVGAFDDLRCQDVRFLEEASKIGRLVALVSDDARISTATGKPAKFPLAERLYLVRSVRFVAEADSLGTAASPNPVSELKALGATVWVDRENNDNARRTEICREAGLKYHIIPSGQLTGFPVPKPSAASGTRKKVVVTGCYDWLHSGHVRFFEEVSSYGDLYAVVGHDANIRSLKGEGHPLVSEHERRYMVGSIRYVTQALISSGEGWLDADPEIQQIRPAIYAVNEDGDRGGKREYCAERGIEYLVLKRIPAPGLPQRSSTELRGF
jgi:cytidyltransferase-like protein